MAFSYFSDLIQYAPDEHRGEAIGHAQQQLEVICMLAGEADVPLNGDYTFGHRPHAAAIIVGAAQRYGLVVMGTHGRTESDRLVLGSEISKAPSCGDIPVLVCH